MRISQVLAVAVLCAGAGVSRADTMMQTYNGNAYVSLPGSASYSSGPGTGTTSVLTMAGPAQLSAFANLGPEITLAPGTVIDSATLVFTVLPESGTALASGGFNLVTTSIPNPGNPTSIQPTFQSQTSFSIGNVMSVNGVTGSNGVFDFTPTIVSNSQGVSISGLTGALLFAVTGSSVEAYLASNGFNWAGMVSAQPEADLTYTEALDVTYGPAAVPEPASGALLGTAMLGLAGFAGYRRAAGA